MSVIPSFHCPKCGKTSVAERDEDGCGVCPHCPAPAPQASPCVKPLKWEASGGDGTGSFRGDGIGLRYYAYRNGDDGFWHSYTEGFQMASFAPVRTLEAAKALAQADYDARIRSAIEVTHSAASTVEPVAINEQIRDIFCEITAKATPYGSGPPEDPDRVTMYLVPAGPIHRAAGKLGYQMFGGEEFLAHARAEIARLKAAPTTSPEPDVVKIEKVIDAWKAELPNNRHAWPGVAETFARVAVAALARNDRGSEAQ